MHNIQLTHRPARLLHAALSPAFGAGCVRTGAGLARQLPFVLGTLLVLALAWMA